MITCSQGVADKMRQDSKFDDWCKQCLTRHYQGHNKIVSIWSIDHNQIIISSDRNGTEIKFVWEL